MPEYYHNLITEKSFKVLQELRKRFDFILIGGWAVFLYTESLKSKDIDIILDYGELEKFKKEFKVSKNERLKKYEAKKEEVDVDIYLPYFSKLGIPVEDIMKHCNSVEGFTVPIPEMLMMLKIYTFKQRKGTNKGQKDLIDILSLIKKDKIDWDIYNKLIKQNNFLELNKELKELLSLVMSVPELNISNHQMAKLKKKVVGKL